MAEQLGGVGVLVRFELPGLTRGEDGDHAGPVGRLEGSSAVDEDEGDGVRADRGHGPADLDHVCAGGVGGIGWDEDAVVEEGFDV